MRRGARLLLAAALVTGASGAPASTADEFRFERRSNYESTLTFASVTGDPAPPPLRLRAGSGTIADECTINFGWLPRGAYDVQSHDVGLEGRIAGSAWALSDQQCYDGTFRTQLLIHSEMAPDGGQDNSWEPNFWTGEDPDDYASFGCIKVSYEDILALERLYSAVEAAAGPVQLIVE